MAGIEERKTVRWGFGDVAIGIGLSWFLTIIFAPLVFAATGATQGDVPLTTVALLQIPFDGAMFAVAIWASVTKGNGPVIDFGFTAKLRDMAGILVGLATQWVALLLYVPLFWFDLTSADDVSKPARELTDKAHDAGGVVLLVLIVVVLAPIVEELFFRGLVLRSLEHRYGQTWAIVGSAAIFAAVHLEPLQFPALFLFGLVAAVMATRTGRLGPGIWAHFAFNAMAVITLLS
jgi:membrane protease YdiL (CAAX protease family)